jgi:hypothetical protein
VDERLEATIGGLFALLAVALGLGLHFGPAATAAELAILAPLVEGGDLDGWTVEGIDAVTDGVIMVHLLHGTSRMNLQIAAAMGGSVAPPVTAGPYAVFATHLAGEDARGTVATSLVQSLGRVLDANLATAPIPEGLAPYAPHDVAPTPAP